MKALISIVFALQLAASIIALEPDVEAESRIVGVQQISGSVGIVFTKARLYRTDDGGGTWNALPLADEGVIAGVTFTNTRRGWAVVFDRVGEQLVLALTKNGGYSWETRSAVARVFGEDTYLDEASMHASGETVTITFRVPTNSNFEGRAVFRTNDGGITWTPLERSIEKRHNDESQAIASRNWSVKTGGSCADTKRGCFQESTLIESNGRDITPPAIKQAATVARLDAERRAATEVLLLPPNGSVRTSLNRGFDKCTAGTIAQMQTWWNNSPLYDSNIYISGRNRGCSQAQLNANWVNQVSTMGWGLIPTIVGYQSPCSVCTTCSKHSFDTAVAETQGRGEADIAVTDATNLGLTAGSILYYDMERYDETGATPGCRAASTAFLKGWTERVRELNYRSGTYGSPRNAIDDWQFMPAASRMEAVWMARWDNVQSVWTYVSFSNFPNNVWNNHQRIKQWQAPHDETWGGVTFNIDGNIADGPVAGVAIPKNRNADFDGDGKADLSVYRPDPGVWIVLNSSNSTVSYIGFGLAADIPTPGDYDGDGKTDQAVFRPSDGVWHILAKGLNYTARSFGQAGDIPAAGDYNGDGKTDIATFRPSTGQWFIANSDSLGTFTYASWGLDGDKPVVGDYDGDGRSDIAVWRPSNGAWYVLRSSDGAFTIDSFGLPGDLPSQGDFDGDGKTDHTVFRPSNGVWYVYRSSDRIVEYYTWGLSGDIPVPGAFDTDAKDDVAVFRPSNGGWYVLRSSGGFFGANWGIATDKPVPNAYLPR
jgi:hypothetical protein